MQAASDSSAIHIRITGLPLDPAVATAFVETPDAGAVCSFIGTVRAHHHGRAVVGLHYEAFEDMATVLLRRICHNTMERYGVLRVFVEHRVGDLAVGDIAVVVAVSSGHRGASFDGCRHIIDDLKQDVPIWKREAFADGQVLWDVPGSSPSGNPFAALAAR